MLLPGEVPGGDAAQAVKPGPGICCSGGGIRSAAFNLGALQALERAPEAGGPSELDRARWLSAVSGGSYLAAAWITGRDALARPLPAGVADAWSRQSPEEDHLRRNASYMAPGFVGKLRALNRFLLC